MTVAACPPPEKIESLLQGAAVPAEAAVLEAHVDLCPDCQAAVNTLRLVDDTLVANLKRAAGQRLDLEPGCQAALEHVFEQLEATRASVVQPREAAGDAAELGSSIRDYKLLALLGEGGMGKVYKAEHAKLRRIVALKLLPSDRSLSRNALLRFEREMQAVGTLDHPNIVRALDAGEFDGKHYLAMEYIAGKDVAQIARSFGPLPVAEACDIIRQAALGLQHAHEAGLVHRDLKPGNLMLSETGTVKLLDLGLARLRGDSIQDEVTTAGEVMGTIDYMAPEQGVDAREADIRADIYSLGATLYRLLAGQTPFSGQEYQSPVKKLMAVATIDPPPLESKRGDVPTELVSLVKRMMAKSPQDRPATPAEVVAKLAPFCVEPNLRSLFDAPRGSVGTVRPTEPARVAPVNGGLAKDVPPKSRMPLVAIAAAGVAALLLGIVLFWRTPQGTVRIEINDPSITASFSGDSLTIQQEGTEPAVLRVGDAVSAGRHTLKIKRGDLEFETERFEVKQRGETSIRVELADNAVVVLSDGAQVGKAMLPEAAPAAQVVDDPDRAAALWALGLGARLSVLEEGKPDEYYVLTPAELPAEKFWLIMVQTGSTKVVDADFDRLRPLERLQTIHFDEAPAITNVGLAKLQHIKTLHNVGINGSQITGEGFQVLEGATWYTVSFHGLKHADEAAKYFATMPHLNEIQMFWSDITRVGIERLARAENLSYLRFQASSLGDDAMPALARMPKLQNLDLQSTKLTDAGLEALASANELTILSIAKTEVTGTGLIHLQKLERLVDLNLNYLPLKAADLEPLKVLTSLRRVQLYETGLPDDAVLSLHAALPKCHIEWDGGVLKPSE